MVLLLIFTVGAKGYIAFMTMAGLRIVRKSENGCAGSPMGIQFAAGTSKHGSVSFRVCRGKGHACRHLPGLFLLIRASSGSVEGGHTALGGIRGLEGRHAGRLRGGPMPSGCVSGGSAKRSPVVLSS